MDGRAEGAPELRRAGKEGQLLAVQLHEITGATVHPDGYAYPSTVVDGEAVPEAYLHDERVLPHLLKGDLSKMFLVHCRRQKQVKKWKTKTC